MFIKTSRGRKGFMKWKDWIKCKQQEANFCKTTETITARSGSRTSTCKYKDGNIIKRHNEVMGNYSMMLNDVVHS
jgi:hypothetical protein